jgi:hypothetical protein
MIREKNAGKQIKRMIEREKNHHTLISGVINGQTSPSVMPPNLDATMDTTITNTTMAKYFFVETHSASENK